MLSKFALVLVLISGPAPQRYSGFAASYSRGTMEKVARHRGMPVVSCMVASFRLPLGRWLDVLGQRTGVRRRCKVVDICHPRDCARIRRRGIVVELDYTSNRAVCGSSVEPPRYCPVIVTEVSP